MFFISTLFRAILPVSSLTVYRVNHKTFVTVHATNYKFVFTKNTASSYR